MTALGMSFAGSILYAVAPNVSSHPSFLRLFAVTRGTLLLFVPCLSFSDTLCPPAIQSVVVLLSRLLVGGACGIEGPLLAMAGGLSVKVASAQPLRDLRD